MHLLNLGEFLSQFTTQGIEKNETVLFNNDYFLMDLNIKLK